ncbi:hypothetical protein FF1_019512 [Malus domestica]
MGVSSSNRPQIQKMGTLQKFKLLTTQCDVAQSPTRSPRSSPLIQLPRCKPTLLTLLTRSSSRRRDSTDSDAATGRASDSHELASQVLKWVATLTLHIAWMNTKT